MSILLEQQPEVIGSLGSSMAADATSNESLHHAADALEQAFGADAGAVLADITNAAMGKCVLDPCLSDHDRSVPQKAGPAVMSITQVVTGLEALLANPDVSAEAQNGVHMILGQLALAYSPQGYPMGRQRMRFGGIQNGLWRRGEAYFAAAREVIARHCQEDTCAYGGLNRAMAINPHDMHVAGWGQDIKKRNVRKQLASNLMLVGAALAERHSDPKSPQDILQVATGAETANETTPKAGAQRPRPQDECLHASGALHTETETERSAELSISLVGLMQEVPWLKMAGVGTSDIVTTILYEDEERVARIVDCTHYNQTVNEVAVAARRTSDGRKHANNAVLRGTRFLVGGRNRLKSVTHAVYPLRCLAIKHRGGALTRAYFAPPAVLDGIPTVLLLGIVHGKDNESRLMRVYTPGVQHRACAMDGSRSRTRS